MARYLRLTVGPTTFCDLVAIVLRLRICVSTMPRVIIDLLRTWDPYTLSVSGVRGSWGCVVAVLSLQYGSVRPNFYSPELILG